MFADADADADAVEDIAVDNRFSGQMCDLRRSSSQSVDSVLLCDLGREVRG